MAIRVLHVTSTLGGGGVAQMLVNYRDHLDDQDVSFDFIVHGNRVGEHEEYFARAGSQIFHAPPKRSAPFQNYSLISNVIRNGNYDVVHAHQNLSNLVPILLAKYHQVPVRISHGHGYPSVLRPIAFLLRKGIESTATDYFACTAHVGEWLHPKKWDTKAGHSFIMRNAFDLSRFTFSGSARESWRQKLGLGSSPTMIQVGRLSEEKNHTFSISLLSRLRANAPWKLLIIGDGPMKESLTEEVKDQGLVDDVIFLGFQSDVPGLLSAADLAVMPSISEGLGLAAVEAQASSLHMIASDALPEEVIVTDFIKLMPLELERWTRYISDKVLTRSQSDLTPDGRIHSFNIEPAAREYLQYVAHTLAQTEADFS